MSLDLRSLVVARANGRCEYCKMHQSLQGATFHVEHVIPRVLGGSSHLDNLALACPSCNLHKSDRVSVLIEKQSQAIPLFNPRIDDWKDHFDWDDKLLVGKTEIGRVTIKALELNQERRVKIRFVELLLGLFPP